MDMPTSFPKGNETQVEDFPLERLQEYVSQNYKRETHSDFGWKEGEGMRLYTDPRGVLLELWWSHKEAS